MRAAKARDALKLLGTSRFEENVLGWDGVAVYCKEAIRSHPGPGAFVQIDTVRIVMAVLGLVTYYRDWETFGKCAPQKAIGTFTHLSPSDALAIHEALQALPGEFAIWQQANAVPNLLFCSGEIRLN